MGEVAEVTEVVARCHSCWETIRYCRCGPPEGLCPAHQWDNVRSRAYACTCSGDVLFECGVCREYVVPKKLPGIGYVCGPCMRTWDDDG